MKPLMQFRVPFFGVLFAAGAFALATGCAGVKMNAPTGTGGTGNGGTGGIGTLPPINGLESLTVSPPSASITLTSNSLGMIQSGTAQFNASGSVNGVMMDITDRVTWYVDLKGATVLNLSLIHISE